MNTPNPRRLTPPELESLFYRHRGDEIDRIVAFGRALADYYLQTPPNNRIPLSQLPIPQLTYGALRRSGYTYLDEIAQLTDLQLRLIRGIGALGSRRLREIITKHYRK